MPSQASRQLRQARRQLRQQQQPATPLISGTAGLGAQRAACFACLRGACAAAGVHWPALPASLPRGGVNVGSWPHL